MTRINDEELERRIKGYLTRTKRGEVKSYPLEKEGTYKIVSGSQGDYRGREELSIVEGRYIDAVSYAVQQPDFLGDWCDWSVPDNCNNGYVEPVKIVKLSKKQISEDLVKKLKTRGKRK